MSDSVRNLEIARLNLLLQPCAHHHNPAHIERDVYFMNMADIARGEGDCIVCDKCLCKMPISLFASAYEAVEWWNDRPFVDTLLAVIAECQDRIEKMRNGG